MRIFFASCVTENDDIQTQRITSAENALKARGHSVYSYVYNLSYLDDSRSFGDLAETILKCDAYIAEMSLPSQTLGFQIAFALNNTLPCLYLYDENTRGRPDAPLAGHPSRLLKITSYNDNNLARKVESFLLYAEKQMSTKRTSFMSTQGIDNFLDDESKRLGMHKAELIRQILHQAAEKSA